MSLQKSISQLTLCPQRPDETREKWFRSCKGREIVLRQAGALAKDEGLEALPETIYAARRPAETEFDKD